MHSKHLPRGDLAAGPPNRRGEFPVSVPNRVSTEQGQYRTGSVHFQRGKMEETGRVRLREPSVYESRLLRQLTVTARSPLFSLFALSCLEPSLYLPCVFENPLTPFPLPRW